MSGTAFTPGFWYAETDEWAAWVFAKRPDGGDDYGIADCDPCIGEDVPEGQSAANARLIAAAPALYAALVKANATLTRFAESGFVLDPFECTEIDEALAKAVAP